jgi:DnaJ-class molecular chaperone
MAADDLYAVLQVHPAAEPDVVRAAYHVLITNHRHDDDAGPRRADLDRAWAVLGDPRARRTYDRQLHAAQSLRADPTEAQAQPQHVLPPGHASGVVLDYGRFQGWSLGQLAQHEPAYLRWLARTPSGRSFRADIESLLGDQPGPPGAGRA